MKRESKKKKSVRYLLNDIEQFYVSTKQETKKNLIQNLSISRKQAIKKNTNKPIPQLPNDLIISKILVRLPPELLQSKFRYVCKSWYEGISTPNFAYQNFQHSKPDLIIHYYMFSMVSHALKIKTDDKHGFYLRRRDIPMHAQTPLHPRGQFRPSCDGFLLMNRTDRYISGKLYVTNNTTKQIISLPPSPTNCHHHWCGCALAFNPKTKLYKVVHMYDDQFGFEIFNLCGSGSGSAYSDHAWRRVPGPFKNPSERPFDLGKYTWADPVVVNKQFLHWDVETHEFIVSMDVSDEKCRKIFLPCRYKQSRFRNTPRLLEMNGVLAVMSFVSKAQIDIWILKDFHEEVWIMQQSITTASISFGGFCGAPKLYKLKPVISVCNGEVILFIHKDAHAGPYSGMYAYEVKLGRIRKLRMKFKDYNGLIVHSSSLITLNPESEADKYFKNLCAMATQCYVEK